MNYIAIDFSLNSPGICIYNDNTNKYHFISYIKQGLGTKKEQKLQEEISQLREELLDSQKQIVELETGESLEEDLTDSITSIISTSTGGGTAGGGTAGGGGGY